MRRPPNVSNQPRLPHGTIHFAQINNMAPGALVAEEDPEGPRYRGCRPGDLVVASPNVENLSFGLRWRADVTLQGLGKTVVTIRLFNSGAAATILPACDFSYVVIPK